MTADCVLVTGAFGLVGSAVVAELADQRRRVVATDLDAPGNRKRAKAFAARPDVEVRWADLTSPTDVETLLAAVAPTAIIHLAAIIPPFCYARPGLARAVNVDATASLVKAASAMPIPPRFVQASSVAVYGARNPYRNDGLLTTSTPLRPNDLYGAHKVMAEQYATASDLDWVVLRLGGVLLAEPRWTLDRDLIFFEAVLPSDGRIQTVDVRDVAHAFCAAAATDHVREVFLIGGDDTHASPMPASEPSPQRQWVWRAACRQDGQATPTTMRHGSPPTGWTPSTRRMSLPTNVIPYPQCTQRYG